jgi:hypothetical protein
MNELTHPQLKSLLQSDTPPCISLYVPLSMAELNEQGILSGCYRNLIESARALLDKSYSERVVTRMLAPLSHFQIPERLRDTPPRGTLAIFKSPTLEGFIHLPEEMPGIAVVADSFHIKPLLDKLMPPRNFYVLDVQSRHATLYKSDRERLDIIQSFQANEVSEIQIPESGNLFKRQLESLLTRTGLRRQHTQAQHLSSEFLTRVEAQVTAHMIFTLASPLFVVGKRHCTNQYMRINRYPDLHSTPIWAAEGRIRNEAFLKAIHAAAVKQHEKILKREKDKNLTALRKARRKGLLEQDLHAVVRALTQGQVRTLFIKKNELLWGTVDWRSGRFRLNPSQTNAFDDDIIDDCIEKALVSEGTKIVCLDDDDLAPGEIINPVTAILAPPDPRVAPVLVRNHLVGPSRSREHLHPLG